jgi:DNA repair protein RadC
MKNVNKPSTSIKYWAADDRPREKLLLNGPASLSNSELLAILIINGNTKQSALDIAKAVLKLGNNNLNDLGKLNLKDLQKVPGIGIAKSIMLMAALELGRRRLAGEVTKKSMIRSSSDIADYFRHSLKDFQHEVFAILFLNQANRVNYFEVISRGGLTGTIADPRIILKKALEENATSMVLCHNHPSGNLKPSRADEALTLKIRNAAAYLDIKILDHLIVSEEGYFSFADEGLL